MSSDQVTVGTLRVPMPDAIRSVGAYLDEERNRSIGRPFAFPAYDRLDTGTGPGELNDGDLLAPVLLSVSIKPASLYGLQAIRADLEAVLRDPVLSRPLFEQSDDDIDRTVRALYTLLDDRARRPRGIKATKLSKVLHRKAPQAIVLYDSRIHGCYIGLNEVAHAWRGTWADFMACLTRHVRNDLIRESAGWRHLRKAAAVPPDVSDVRLLDIVGWSR